jgi:hypothetical protein
MALKRQPIAQAIDPMAAIKKFPMPKARPPGTRVTR